MERGWLTWRGLWPRVRRADLALGLLIGTIFAVEFLGLFIALDLTSVGHSALIMYSMFDRKLMVRFKDGQMGEVQIWPPGMEYAKSKADLKRFGRYPETYVDPKTGETKPFVGAHKLYEITRSPKSTPEQIAHAIADQKVLFDEVQAALDASWAEKLGNGAPSAASKSLASATDNSLASQFLSTADAIAADPASGTQALSSDQSLARSPDRAQNAPLLSSKNRSDMGTVLSSADTSNMGAAGSEVNSVKPLSPDRAALSQTKAEWGYLPVVDENGVPVSARELLSSIDEDMRKADVIEACNPKGGA